MYKIKVRGGNYIFSKYEVSMIYSKLIAIHARMVAFFFKNHPPPLKDNLGIASGGGDIDFVPLPPSYANED